MTPLMDELAKRAEKGIETADACHQSTHPMWDLMLFTRRHNTERALATYLRGRETLLREVTMLECRLRRREAET